MRYSDDDNRRNNVLEKERVVCCWRLTQPARTSSRNCTWYAIMDLKITPSGQTIAKPTALCPVANTDTKLLIYGLFQKGRVLAQDGTGVGNDLVETGSAPLRPLSSRISEVARWRNSPLRTT